MKTAIFRGVSVRFLILNPAHNDLPGATVKQNPSKRLFLPQIGEKKREYPSPISVGRKRVFNIDKEGK
jgi:hypothetical protein